MSDGDQAALSERPIARMRQFDGQVGVRGDLYSGSHPLQTPKEGRASFEGRPRRKLQRIGCLRTSGWRNDAQFEFYLCAARLVLKPTGLCGSPRRAGGSGPSLQNGD